MKTYAAIRAIASYLPAEIEQNEATPVNKKIGISERHIATKDEATSDMAVHAAENLFETYDIVPADIDFVLLCVQTPDYPFPTTACLVQDRLGISQTAGAMDYNLGCSGYPYGLGVARGLIETGMAKNLLLLTASVYAKYVNKKDGIIRPLFGDGGTATLVSAVEADHPMLDGFVFGTDGSRGDSLIIPAGGSRHMPCDTPEKSTSDARGNTRTNYNMFMDGNVITGFSMHTVPPLVEAVLEKAGLTTEELDGAVFHQANHFLLEHLRPRCGLADVPFYNDIEHTGNLVSGSIPYALESINHAGKLADRHRVLLAGFGVGLSWGGCVADFGAMLAEEK